MPKNIYKNIAEAKSKVGKTLSNISHTQRMGAMDIKNIQAGQKTFDNVVEGIALTKNIYDTQKRIKEEKDEAENYMSTQTYEEITNLEGGDIGNAVTTTSETKKRYEAYVDPNRKWYDEKKTLYRDLKTNELESVGDILALKTEEKQRKRRGLDKPFEQPTPYGKQEMDDFFSMCKSEQLYGTKSVEYAKTEKGKGSSSLNILEKVLSYGKANKKDYSVDSESLIGKQFQYDYNKIMEDWDSIFYPEKEVENEVMQDASNMIIENTSNVGKEKEKLDERFVNRFGFTDYNK